MFNDIMVGSNNIIESKRFYDAIMAVLGYPSGKMDKKGRCFYIGGDSAFYITTPLNGEEATSGNGMTIGFKAKSAEQVNEWHEAGVIHGGMSCENPPGLRDDGRKRYLAYLRGPDGNKLCAVYFP